MSAYGIQMGRQSFPTSVSIGVVPHTMGATRGFSQEGYKNVPSRVLPMHTMDVAEHEVDNRINGTLHVSTMGSEEEGALDTGEDQLVFINTPSSRKGSYSGPEQRMYKKVSTSSSILKSLPRINRFLHSEEGRKLYKSRDAGPVQDDWKLYGTQIGKTGKGASHVQEITIAKRVRLTDVWCIDGQQRWTHQYLWFVLVRKTDSGPSKPLGLFLGMPSLSDLWLAPSGYTNNSTNPSITSGSSSNGTNTKRRNGQISGGSTTHDPSDTGATKRAVSAATRGRRRTRVPGSIPPYRGLAGSSGDGSSDDKRGEQKVVVESKEVKEPPTYRADDHNVVLKFTVPSGFVETDITNTTRAYLREKELSVGFTSTATGHSSIWLWLTKGEDGSVATPSQETLSFVRSLLLADTRNTTNELTTDRQMARNAIWQSQIMDNRITCIVSFDELRLWMSGSTSRQSIYWRFQEHDPLSNPSDTQSRYVLWHEANQQPPKGESTRLVDSLQRKAPSTLDQTPSTDKNARIFFSGESDLDLTTNLHTGEYLIELPRDLPRFTPDQFVNLFQRAGATMPETLFYTIYQAPRTDRHFLRIIDIDYKEEAEIEDVIPIIRGLLNSIATRQSFADGKEEVKLEVKSSFPSPRVQLLPPNPPPPSSPSSSYFLSQQQQPKPIQTANEKLQRMNDTMKDYKKTYTKDLADEAKNGKETKTKKGESDLKLLSGEDDDEEQEEESDENNTNWQKEYWQYIPVVTNTRAPPRTSIYSNMAFTGRLVFVGTSDYITEGDTTRQSHNQGLSIKAIRAHDSTDSFVKVQEQLPKIQVWFGLFC